MSFAHCCETLIEDYEFKHTSFDTEFIGDLTEEQQEFLEECWYER